MDQLSILLKPHHCYPFQACLQPLPLAQCARVLAEHYKTSLLAHSC